MVLWVKPNHFKAKMFFLHFLLLILKIHLIYNFVIIDIQNKHIDFFMFF
jgi:hypothetical protein